MISSTLNSANIISADDAAARIPKSNRFANTLAKKLNWIIVIYDWAIFHRFGHSPASFIKITGQLKIAIERSRTSSVNICHWKFSKFNVCTVEMRSPAGQGRLRYHRKLNRCTFINIVIVCRLCKVHCMKYLFYVYQVFPVYCMGVVRGSVQPRKFWN